MNETALSLVTFLLLGSGIGLCTFLFVSLKQELHVLKKRHVDRVQLAEHLAEHVLSDISALQEALAEMETRVGQLPQLAAPTPSMNTTRRSQVLRMHRRGDRSEQISAALGIPRGEVDLLLKVHQATNSG